VSTVENLKIQKSKISEGSHFEKKSNNRHISAMVLTITTKFCTMTHVHPHNPVDR